VSAASTAAWSAGSVAWLRSEIVVLGMAPDRLDRVEFGAVGRQVAEVDAGRGQCGERGFDPLAVMD